MALPTRLNPFRPLARFEPFGDLEDLFRGLAAPRFAREYERTLDMRLDVCEDDSAYIVNVDMPGVRKSDIDVSVEGRQVTISAEVKREESRDKGKEIYNERYTGNAFRSFVLPSDIDGSKAQASYDGGVLTLTLPKVTGGGSRRLPIG